MYYEYVVRQPKTTLYSVLEKSLYHLLHASMYAFNIHTNIYVHLPIPSTDNWHTSMEIRKENHSVMESKETNYKNGVFLAISLSSIFCTIFILFCAASYFAVVVYFIFTDIFLFPVCS